MGPASLLVLPRGPPPCAAAPIQSTCWLGLGSARLVPRRRWGRGAGRLSTSAVVPRTGEASSPSPCKEEAFDWLDQWYPIAPVCDLDPGAPHGKTVLGLSVVAWYDRGAGEWRVFDDACPHRLAPLSEGRIDGKGQLQCVYRAV